jgi:hypothetical protein
MSSQASFHTAIRAVLNICRDIPEALYEADVEIAKRLKEVKGGGKNPPTQQEVSFATIAISKGFELGKTLIYQPNGAQATIDFILKNPDDGKEYKIELKSSKSNNFYLNDGTFLENVIYIISFVVKKTKKCCIVNGENVLTKYDKEKLEKLRELIKTMNSNDTSKNFLRTYVRCANQYSCKQFTEEFMKVQHSKVIERFE